MHENLNDLISYSPNGILSKVLVKNDRFNITLFCMAEGTDMSEHTSTKQATICVIEGNGVFDLAGEKIEMSAGVFIHMPENTVHSLSAKENTSFLLTLNNS